MPVVEYGVPPVSFRSNWYGCATEKSGKFVAAAVAESSDAAFDPAATAAEMEGLLVVMKLPHIAVDFFSSDLGVRGRKRERLGRGIEGFRGRHTHERACKIGALVRGWGPEVAGYVNAVLGSDDGVLVFICSATPIGEGFGEPVGGADESCFRVDVLLPG